MSQSLEDLANQFANLELEVKHMAMQSFIIPSSMKAPFAPILVGNSAISELKEQRSSSSNSILQANAKLPNAELPKFDGSDLEDYAKEFLRFLRLTGTIDSDDQVKIDWFLQGCHVKIKKLVQKVADENRSFGAFLSKLENLFPKIENDISIREKLKRFKVWVENLYLPKLKH